MHVRVVRERLPPRVQHREHSHLSAQTLATESHHGLRRRAKQRLVERGAGDRVDIGERRRQREDDMEVGDGEEVGLLLLDPFPRAPLQTPPAVAIAARVVRRDLVAARVECAVGAERSGAAGDDVSDGARLLMRAGAGAHEVFAM